MMLQNMQLLRGAESAALRSGGNEIDEFDLETNICARLTRALTRIDPYR
jgi:hypothetical protein